MTTDYAARRDTAAADVLDAIDAVTTPRCGTCEVDLHPDGPSPWWCSEPCAVVWQQSITPPLPDQSDMEPASLPRRIVCRGTPDRMDVWLQHGDGPDQCAELAEWLSANSLPVNDIPVDSTIHVEGGQITVDVLRRGDNGGIPVDPAGNPYRDTLTVPLIHEWPARPMTHQERWYHVALAVQRSSRERWPADRQMVEVTTAGDHGSGIITGLPPATPPEPAVTELRRYYIAHRVTAGALHDDHQTIETTTVYDPTDQRVTGDGTGTPLPPASAAPEPGGHDELGTKDHCGHVRTRLFATDAGTVLQNPAWVRGGH